MNLFEYIHGHYVFDRRVRVLCEHLVKQIPKGASVLDVGCGDGLLAYLITQKRPDINLRGIDVLIREKTRIPVDQFDGSKIPYVDASFDMLMFIDVFHHTKDPMSLLREAVRVARKSILIKDHTLNGLFAGPTLRVMDWFGNAHYGVTLPYNYWPRQKWLKAFEELGLSISSWKDDLRLYPRPANCFFDRSLHFLAQLNLA